MHSPIVSFRAFGVTDQAARVPAAFDATGCLRHYQKVFLGKIRHDGARV
jgi:hypothetical protein